MGNEISAGRREQFQKDLGGSRGEIDSEREVNSINVNSTARDFQRSFIYESTQMETVDVTVFTLLRRRSGRQDKQAEKHTACIEFLYITQVSH